MQKSHGRHRVAVPWTLKRSAGDPRDRGSGTTGIILDFENRSNRDREPGAFSGSLMGTTGYYQVPRSTTFLAVIRFRMRGLGNLKVLS